MSVRVCVWGWECVGIDLAVTKAAALGYAGDTLSTFISGQDIYNAEEWINVCIITSWVLTPTLYMQVA